MFSHSNEIQPCQTCQKSDDWNSRSKTHTSQLKILHTSCTRKKYIRNILVKEIWFFILLFYFYFFIFFIIFLLGAAWGDSDAQYQELRQNLSASYFFFFFFCAFIYLLVLLFLASNPGIHNDGTINPRRRSAGAWSANTSRSWLS